MVKLVDWLCPQSHSSCEWTFQDHLEASSRALIAVDWSDHILLLNPVAQRLLGYAQTECVGRPINDLLLPTPSSDCSQSDIELCNSSEIPPPSQRELGARMLAKRQDGACFPVEVYRWYCGHREDLRRVLHLEPLDRNQEDREVLEEMVRLAGFTSEIGGALLITSSLEEALQKCAQAVVCHLDAAFARIWTIHETQDSLELQASAGMYTHLDGEHASIPIGKFKIGMIAQERKPHLTNQVLTDPRIGDPEWARRTGMVAFAGYPLLVEGRLVGVLAMFARHRLNLATMRALASVAGTIAQYVERKRAEQALSQSESILREMAEHIQEVFWLQEPRSNQVLYVSPAYETVWGLSCQRLLEDPSAWLEVIHPEDRSLVTGTLATKERSEVEFRLLKPTGATRWIRARYFPVRDGTGRIYRRAGVAEDITERKELEHQLRHIQKMEAIGRLAGGIAHDFNNLLTVINGYSEVALNLMGSSSPLRPLLEEVNRAGEAAAALTRQLLAFSRKQVLTPVLLDLNRLILDFERILHRLLGEDMVLTLRLEPSLHILRADPGQLEQVLINLAVNARDAMPKGGVLVVETRNVSLDEEFAQTRPGVVSGPYVLLTVSDNGCGMDPETLSRIFEPFFTTKELGKGTGLGLATVHGIIKQSGGHVFVSSERGKGTTFELYFPYPILDEPPVALAAPEAPAPRGWETVLVVEDEPGVRSLLRQQLSALGYRVLDADGWEQALNHVREFGGPIHLLLTDVVMPGKNGRELAEEIRSMRPRIRVVFVSGYTDDVVIPNGSEPDIAFLQKPFALSELACCLHELLAKG